MALISAVGGSIINVANRKLKQVNFAIIQFNYALMASALMGACVLAFYLKTGKVPFIYDSSLIYLEILVASFLNMVAQNL